ncbi:hypothetical protein [Sutcliffiella halmapala]|uniref:hypothetical protein n=1 Tax=Sutcliffiella halmapala TaxID=79882 RepID=UPI000994A089|nr:hypothetical protein [Sutcliffiella halmapala]
MKKLRRPYRIFLILLLSVGGLFFLYIQTIKDEVVASAFLDKSGGGVTVNIQNPYLTPIKIYHAEVVDENEKRISAKTYSIILNGLSSSSDAVVDQEYMSKKTDMFEELNEVIIPSNSSKKEKNYYFYLMNKKDSSSVHNASKVSISFKVFKLIPFRTNVHL